MYFRSLLAQAGIGNNETSPGEDHLAVDVNVDLVPGTARVQIKTGTKKLNKNGSITVPVQRDWKSKWGATRTPVYLVYVHLKKVSPAEWIDHADVQTVVHATAFWSRVNGVTGSSVNLPAQNRLTVETFDRWVQDFDTTSWGRAASA